MGSKKIWGKFIHSLKGGDWSGAIQSINVLIKTEPDNPNHYLKRGDIYQKKGDRDDAVRSYLTASRILKKDGFFKKALAVNKMVLRIDPQNKEAVDGTHKILKALGIPQQASHEKLSSKKLYEKEVPSEDVAAEERGREYSVQQTSEESSSLPADVSGPSHYPGNDFNEQRAVRKSIREFLLPFTEDAIEKILSRSEIKSFLDKDKIVEEGASGDSVFIIKDGKAKVITHILGRTIELAQLSKGDLFGEVSYLTGIPRTADVIADGEIEVFEINKLLLDEMIESKPEIMSQINQIYTTRAKDSL